MIRYDSKGNEKSNDGLLVTPNVGISPKWSGSCPQIASPPRDTFEEDLLAVILIQMKHGVDIHSYMHSS